MAKAERLPPGAKRPSPSLRVGVGRSDPQAAAVKDAAAGSTGDEGLGSAAWRRRIAPRHRDAVRGFFSDDPRLTDAARDGDAKPAGSSETPGPTGPSSGGAGDGSPK